MMILLAVRKVHGVIAKHFLSKQADLLQSKMLCWTPSELSIVSYLHNLCLQYFIFCKWHLKKHKSALHLHTLKKAVYYKSSFPEFILSGIKQLSILSTLSISPTWATLSISKLTLTQVVN